MNARLIHSCVSNDRADAVDWLFISRNYVTSQLFVYGSCKNFNLNKRRKHLPLNPIPQPKGVVIIFHIAADGGKLEENHHDFPNSEDHKILLPFDRRITKFHVSQNYL